jgi:transposase
MDLLSVIRRWHFRQGMSIREIERRTALSRNTIRKYLRSDTLEPVFKTSVRPSKLDEFSDKLSGWLVVEASKSRKQKRTAKQMHADLVVLGFDGSYERVSAFVRAWKAERQREQQTSGRGTFVPLVFEAGEAFQFDWSEDFAVLGGKQTKLQVAHDPVVTQPCFYGAGLSAPDPRDVIRRIGSSVSGIGRCPSAGYL